MQIEFSRADIEKMLLLYANTLVPTETFNEVLDGYRLPLAINVGINKKEEDAAQ